MNELKLRVIPFEFDGVEFIWNPDNPQFSVSMNLLSFWAPALERYFVRAMVLAEKEITDPQLLEVAKAFRLQEGQHAKSHQRHLVALKKKYPGLQQLSDDLVKLVDDLFEQQNLPFHLAFMAELEASFTPLFKMMIDNRRKLFSGGDSRVASLLLWHFCEEVEHRSAAILVYDHVVKRHWYRVSIIPYLYRFHADMVRMALDAFRQHVPGLPEDYLNIAQGYRCVPLRSVAGMLFQLIYSQLPWYNHDRQPLPAWSFKWFEHYDRGDDMRNFYGTLLQEKQ